MRSGTKTQEKARQEKDLTFLTWLLALSFWAGVSWMQIQTQKEMLERQQMTRVRIWDQLKAIRHDLDILVGYTKAKEKHELP